MPLALVLFAIEVEQKLHRHSEPQSRVVSRDRAEENRQEIRSRPWISPAGASHHELAAGSRKAAVNVMSRIRGGEGSSYFHWGGGRGALGESQEVGMFESFWGIYPRRLARKDAERAWRKIPPAKQIDVVNAIKRHVLMWKQQGTEKQFIPYPASWLNGQRWEDEIEVAPEMPQCDWNRNGNRDSSGGRCSEQAVKEHDQQFYCGPHCQRLGLKVVRG